MRDIAGRAIRSESEAQILAGDYRLERLIARGGMAEVYEAHQISEDRRVALKLIASDTAGEGTYRERVMREARAAMDLAHPNVVPVYGAGEADGQLFIAMRLIEGEDLEHVIDADRPLAAERVLDIVRQVAGALDAAHANGLVHRDVKPGNVMVEHPGQEGEHCYVVDFGLATDQDASSLTSTGLWEGTPAYVAPEQLRGERVDSRTDVYALGVLIFHALAGQTPYAREHDSGTLLAHLHAPPPSLTELRPDLPRAVDAVIARSLAKAPDARHPSAGELAGELAHALAGDAQAPETGASGVVARPRPGNLPAEAASFVGRRAELETAREALAGARLLSLIGPGGVGKTSLALHLAASVEAEYSGAWVLELDSVQDAAGLELALARVLGLRLAARESAGAALIEFIGERRLLLVFDNCEPVVAAVRDVAGELLAACPQLTIVATSREPLAIQGEHLYALGPLELPDEDDEPEDVLASDSARLLLQRAAEQGLFVEVEPATAAAVARICARLEGIPLALELAAARLRTLSVSDLELRLQEDLRVLAPSGGGGPDPGRTLDGLIESSWRLLGADEQEVLARLAVFAGTFTLDAAEAVAGGEDGEPREAGPLVVKLADKSLLQVDAIRSEARFRMLQPVREFCLARLAPAELASARAAHRAYYLAHAERAAPMLDSARSAEWLAALGEDQANIRAAIESGVEDGDAQGALRMGIAMRQFWACRGLAGEGIEMLTTILDRAGQTAQPSLRAKAHSAVAHLAAARLGDFRAAEPHALEALRLARSVGDADTTAEALIWLSWTKSFAGHAAEGLALAREALPDAGSIEDPTVMGRLLDAQAIALEQLGDTAAARLAYERAREVFADSGYAPGAASVENRLGDLDLSAGDLASAAGHFALARTTAEDAGDGASVAMAALNLALIDHLEGRCESARELFVDALMTNQACGDRANVAFSIFGLALTEAEAARAAELHGSASHRLAQLEIMLSALEERLRREELERLCSRLGPEGFDHAMERGSGLLVEDILSAVLEADEADPI
jgi:non-specific serine/threonine protein kinase